MLRALLSRRIRALVRNFDTDASYLPDASAVMPVAEMDISQATLSAPFDVHTAALKATSTLSDKFNPQAQGNPDFYQPEVGKLEMKWVKTSPLAPSSYQAGAR